MSGTLDDIANAERNVVQARARLIATMGELQQRLNPRALIKDALREVREKGVELTDEAVEYAKSKPLTVASVVAGLVMFAGRKPIWNMISSRFGGDTETSGDGVGYQARPDPYIEDLSDKETA